MSRAETPEFPDIDYKKQYRGQKCSIDFNDLSPHNYEGLEEYSDPESYLEYYRGCGFDESRWDCPEWIMSAYSVKANRTLCAKCPHAADKHTVGSPEGYSLPGKREKHSSCPLEESFAVGTAFTLRYPRPNECVCNHCGKTIAYFNEGGVSTPEFLDVRFRNRPGKLIIERKDALCPFCRQRLKAVLIPGVQVDFKHRLSERLICAIGRHCKEMGISGLIQQKIAEGYGISREILRQYLSDKFDEIRKIAEANQRARIRTYHRSKTFRYSTLKRGTAEGICFHYVSECDTTTYSLMLYFSTFDRTGASLSLSAAFDKEEINVIDAWMHGDFLPRLSSRFSNDHLAILAHYYTSAAFPHIYDTLAFYMAELTIAYGKFLQSGRGAPEDPVITDTLRTCLKGLASGKMSLFEFDMRVFEIYAWSMDWHKGQIMRAARRILTLLRRSPRLLGLARQTISSLPRTEQALPEAQEEVRRVGALIGLELMKNETQQTTSQEDLDERYETCSDLAILRLLYVNPAAEPLPIAPSFPADPFMQEMRAAPESQLPGTPVRQLEPLIRMGLLNNRGFRDPQLFSDNGNLQHQ